jgi:hypothetical protein
MYFITDVLHDVDTASNPNSVYYTRLIFFFYGEPIRYRRERPIWQFFSRMEGDGPVDISQPTALAEAVVIKQEQSTAIKQEKGESGDGPVDISQPTALERLLLSLSQQKAAAQDRPPPAPMPTPRPVPVPATVLVLAIATFMLHAS